MFRQNAQLLLVVSIPMFSLTALVAQTPVASSYKATATITSLGPGTNDCAAGRIPVSVSGVGVDRNGQYGLTEQLCSDPQTGAFSGRFEIRHPGMGSYSGPFNGTFFPSDAVFEVHATWRITHGDGSFSNMIGAGTAKGVASVNPANGGPGPGTIVLDGSTLILSD